MSLLSKLFKKPSEKPKIILSMILFPETNSFSYATFINHIKEVLDVEEETNDKGVGSFRINNEQVQIMVIPLPIPAGDIEGTAKYMYNWPEAVKDLQEHKSHVIIALSNDGSDDMITRYKLLTKINCAILEVTNALAVYSGEQSLLVKKEDYLIEGQSMNETQLPLNLWIYIGPRFIDDETNGYTYGLKTFGKEEIEVLHSSKKWVEIYELLFNAAHYVLMSNITFKEGETFGYTVDEKIPITYSKGRFVTGNSFKFQVR